MSASVWSDVSDLSAAADSALAIAARFWFLVTVVGQWVFVVYVVGFYGGSAIRRDFDMWNRALPHGYVRGEPIGNVVVAIHLFLAMMTVAMGVGLFAATTVMWLPRIRAAQDNRKSIERVTQEDHSWNHTRGAAR